MRRHRGGRRAFTYYDFFAGCGMAGVGLGAEWRCLFANDIDETKASAYRAWHGGEALAVKDVQDVTVSELPGRADLAWASFPCQDLSFAGNGAGLDSGRSGMFWPFLRLMRALGRENRAPGAIALENVPGLLAARGGRDFAAVCEAVSGLDYSYGAAVIDARRFVPQSRPRVFIIGVRDDIDIPSRLLVEGPSAEWHPKALLNALGALSRRAAANWVWWRLPSPAPSVIGLADLIEEEPGGVVWHTPSETRYIFGLMSPLNLSKVEAAKKRGRRVVGTVYRRTRPDGQGERTQRAEARFDNIAGCLRTPGGGSSRQTVLIIEGGEVRSRLLSPREAARLMGLPDAFQLPARYNDAYHMLGDGVAAPVVRFLAENLFEPLLDETSVATESEPAETEDA